MACNPRLQPIFRPSKKYGSRMLCLVLLCASSPTLILAQSGTNGHRPPSSKEIIPSDRKALRVDELWRPELRRILKGEEWVPQSDAPQFNADPFKGGFPVPDNAKATDGTSFAFEGRRLKLKGVSTFAPRQICVNLSNQRIPCGALARAKLNEQLASGHVICHPRGETEDGIEEVDCRIDRDETLQEALIREGWIEPIEKSDKVWARAIAQRCKNGNDRSLTQRLCP